MLILSWNFHMPLIDTSNGSCLEKVAVYLIFLICFCDKWTGKLSSKTSKEKKSRSRWPSKSSSSTLPSLTLIGATQSIYFPFGFRNLISGFGFPSRFIPFPMFLAIFQFQSQSGRRPRIWRKGEPGQMGSQDVLAHLKVQQVRIGNSSFEDGGGFERANGNPSGTFQPSKHQNWEQFGRGNEADGVSAEIHAS